MDYAYRVLIRVLALPIHVAIVEIAAEALLFELGSLRKQ
jgi:hypothetical protein